MLHYSSCTPFPLFPPSHSVSVTVIIETALPRLRITCFAVGNSQRLWSLNRLLSKRQRKPGKQSIFHQFNRSAHLGFEDCSSLILICFTRVADDINLQIYESRYKCSSRQYLLKVLLPDNTLDGLLFILIHKNITLETSISSHGRNTIVLTYIIPHIFWSIRWPPILK